MISACFDLANLMERSGTGFKTIYDSYTNNADDKKPVVLSYQGFLIIRLFDLNWSNQQLNELGATQTSQIDCEKQRVVALLEKGNCGIKELHANSAFKSRAYFIERIINPLIDEGAIKRIGNTKSKNAFLLF